MKSLKFKVFLKDNLSPNSSGHRIKLHTANCQLPIAFFSCILILASDLSAQDIHFAQFHATPANINPSLTGAFDGDYRFIGNQRSQWRSVSSNPYKTFGISADATNVLNKNFGGGLSIYNDKTGDSDFSTLQFNLSGAYHKTVSKDSLHSISAGIQTGLTQRNINYQQLSFDRQFNGDYYDPNLSTGENFASDSYLRLNLNAGVSWNYRFKENLSFSSGLALYNITKPKQSFKSDNAIVLDRRINFFTNATYSINSKTDILPTLLFLKQGKFKELLLGASVRYMVSEGINEQAVRLGFFGRTRDAGVIFAGYDYNNINAGISYDLTLSGLNPASNYKGGLELSVIYIIKKFRPIVPKYKSCPAFI